MFSSDVVFAQNHVTSFLKTAFHSMLFKYFFNDPNNFSWSILLIFENNLKLFRAKM